MSTDVFTLDVIEYSGGCRIVLSRNDEVVAEHTTPLDLASEEYAAFVAIEAHIEHGRVADGAPSGLAQRLGRWLALSVLGPVAEVLAGHAPVVVVRGNSALRDGPWGLAEIDGRTLAERGLVVVVATDEPASRRPEPDPRSPVRMLAVFSQPHELDALNLREERTHLTQVVRELTEKDGRAVELVILQYGVTRAELSHVAADPRGWDVVHLSGHGTSTSFTFESDDSEPDTVTIDELLKLLSPIRPLFVCISSCSSAGQAADDDLVHLGLRQTALSARQGNLADAVAAELACSVLAMRFAVRDKFGIALTSALYRGLLVEGLTPAKALGRALMAIQDVTPMEMVTPVLLGERGAWVTVRAPNGDKKPSAVTHELPSAPERFVGRVATMSRCVRILLNDTGSRALVLLGMPGIGKSAVATELVHVVGDRFDDVIWCGVPDGADGPTALTEVIVRLEDSLPGVRLVHLVHEPADLAEAVIAVSEALTRSRVLVVLDNVDTWSTDLGWSALLTALCQHDGASRAVITTRQEPVDLPAAVERIGSLSRDEAVLLAGELSRLARFVRGEVAGMAADKARSLARRVIEAADGHPKLLELADGQAGDAGRLSALLNTGPSAADVSAPLDSWTARAVAALAPPDRRAFDLLCVLDERDRTAVVLTGLLEADPHTPSAITSTGLAEMRNDDYRVHPAVAATGRELLTETELDHLVAEIAGFWTSVVKDAVADERAGGSVAAVARSARSAIGYLLRAGDVRMATDAADLVLRRERSPVELGSLTPQIIQLGAAAADAGNRLRAHRLLANLMALIGHPVSDNMTENLRARAIAAGELEMATVLSTDLIGRYRQAQRLDEALALAEEQIELGKQVEVGAWTQLLHENERINILVTMGRADELAEQIQALRERIKQLPPTAEDNDTVRPYWVKELVLDTIYTAALSMRDYRTCLDTAEETIRQKRARDADQSQIARATYRTCFPLMRLGNLEEAAMRLKWCRSIFTEASDTPALAATYSALGEIEDELGRPQAAVEFNQAALRHQYAARTLSGIINAHMNLGHRMSAIGGGKRAFAHHVLAALVADATSYWQAGSTERALTDLVVDANGDDEVTTLEDVWSLVGDDLPGLDIPSALRTLNHEVDPTQDDLDRVLANARRQATERAQQR
ncbi:CHAT domain-containing protein [Amycolatopsis sp. WAC 01375]|uniref:CHAT domain-containing protein n=1 Tax=Amycolatopsis sp. WAC 01375 TaxID=2203194 RepID=UPI00131525FA|nr:CHAT domain-containing protein [Amycolatopsis sp. WAC 01375]